jgi:diguanylate cyclase (GGDEF)-like protein
MLDLTTDDLRVIIHELDQAIYNHEQWSKRLARTMLCRTPCDEHDISEDAHQQCLFGQWYYRYASPGLQKIPGFVAMGVEHQRMHEQAAQLLRDAATGVVSPADFDSFENVRDRMILQVQTLRREFIELMYHRDPLTGAGSRLMLLTSLREFHEMVKRGIQVCSIAMVDMDHFKAINDRYGHLVGDKVLSAAAGYLINCTRSYDKVFRYGGEEFVICTPGLSQEEALILAERLRQGIAEKPVAHDGHEIHVTASFGITTLDPGISVEESLERADKALYAAKSAGRNCSSAWTGETVVASPVA